MNSYWHSQTNCVMETWPQPTRLNPDSIRGSTVPVPLAGISSQVGVSRKKILVVDDSLVVRKVLALKLKASGYDVVEAADGPAAVNIVRQSKPDLMLLDIVFPPDVAHGGGGWDGFQIMDWVRRMDEAKNLPIMIITGCNPDEYEPRALAAGAVGFFRKPINNEELLTTIRQTFGEDAPPSQLPAA